MTDITSDTIAIEVATERLRQERETFDQRRNQEGKWFLLRLIMGYTAVILIPSIAGVCIYIIYNSSSFSGAAVTAATTALLVDVLGLMTAVWKVVLNPESVTKLSPVTDNMDLSTLPGTSKGSKPTTTK